MEKGTIPLNLAWPYFNFLIKDINVLITKRDNLVLISKFVNERISEAMMKEFIKKQVKEKLKKFMEEKVFESMTKKLIEKQFSEDMKESEEVDGENG